MQAETIFGNHDFLIDEIHHPGGDEGADILAGLKDELLDAGRTVVVVMRHTDRHCSVLSIPTEALPKSDVWLSWDKREQLYVGVEGLRSSLATANLILGGLSAGVDNLSALQS